MRTLAILSQASMQGVCTWVSQRGNLVNYYAKALAVIGCAIPVIDKNCI
jgi:hypothetical protein